MEWSEWIQISEIRSLCHWPTSYRLQHLIAWSFGPSNNYIKVFLVTVTCLNFGYTCARKVQHYICCPTCLSSALTTFISSKFCTLKGILNPQNETPPTPLLVNLMWTSALQGLCEWLQLLFFPLLACIYISILQWLQLPVGVMYDYVSF